MGIYYFKIELAEKRIEVECNTKHMFYFCRNYLAEFDKPDFIVRPTLEEIRNEANKTFGEKLKDVNDEKIAVEFISAEASVVLRKIADVFIDSNILLIHGAAVAVEGKCYIFTADSGIGKTTHILNWLEAIPGTVVVNGDKPFVNVVDKKVYGTPWGGKEGLNSNVVASLAGIISLERGDHNSIIRIGFNEILPTLIQQTYRSTAVSPVRSYQLLGMLKDVPCYKLVCNMDKESAIIAYNGLRQ